MSTEVVQIDFSVQLQVVNETDLPNCDNFTDVLFCPSNSSDYMWEICSENGYDNSLQMTYVTQALSQSNFNKYIIQDLVIWLTLLHGSLSTLIVETSYNYIKSHKSQSGWLETQAYPFDKPVGWFEKDSIALMLTINTLKCNPPVPLATCALSELISWVSCCTHS